MDLQLFEPLLNFSRKRKKLLLLLAAAGLSGYGAYKVYHIPSVARKRQRLFNLVGALVSVAELVADSAETAGVVSRDLKQFLQSDSDEIPNSLRQISKIARSNEFSESVVRVTEAFTVGILRGYRISATSGVQESRGSSSFTDQVLERFFSTAGSGFASVVVGSFARNLVLAFYSDNPTSENSSSSNQSGISRRFDSPEGPTWVNVLCDSRCRELIADCIQLFVSTAVAVYLDKTMEINTYDELFSGLTNPKHEKKVADVLVSVCNGAVETLVKTSHQVLTASSPASSSSKPSPASSSSKPCHTSPSRSEALERCLTLVPRRRSLDEIRETGWVSKVSSTFAVPSNRKLVLDLTGRVTFETIRSFLNFMLWKITDGFWKSLDFVHREAIEKALELLTYISEKSVVIATICFAMCLHVLMGARVLVPV
ncbi:protein PHLOEM PROTEIN 2-LIKE A10-like [Aristolochia californica]|uniref:protein PHLOEM PROTEIN 2-LIKE A10-like n=1 Tax=Aristolochia californica TaxID=171875 RepID=UPI0035E0C71E